MPVNATRSDNRATLIGLLTEIYPDDPELRLIATVVHKAVDDVMEGPPKEAADARAYLSGSNFETDCEWLGLDPQRVRDLLERDENEMKQLLTDERIAELHEEYINSNRTLKALAEANGISAPTLSRLFRRAGLPTRRGRKSKKPMIVDATPLQVIPEESPVGAIRDLHDMLKDFRGQARGSVQIQVKFNLEVQL